MSYEHRSIERRQHMRVRAGGDIVLRVGGRQIYGRSVVVDEATLEVRCPLALSEGAIPVGTGVEIELQLDAAAGTWFVAHGTVTRAGTETLLIALGALPAPLPDELAASRTAPIEVMVVDRDRARRTQVSQAFRAEGCHVVEVSAALETLDALADATFATDVIAVADTTPDTVGEQLREYLDTDQVSALIVGIGDAEEWTPSRVQLDPSDAHGLLRAHVKSLLLLVPPRRTAIT